MSLITSIEKLEKEKHNVHAKAPCTYSIIIDEQGRRYLQIDAYGSDQRQIKGKISYTMQFNEDSARRLKGLIGEVFPNLR